MGLSIGKVPSKILEKTIFKHLGSLRKDVIVGATAGEDAAIIRVGNELLAIHCDPISGAYGNIGWIAMNIATNDIAARGVKPCWALSCIMLPDGSNEKILKNICRQMSKAAERLDVSIIGGHSEISIGLDHPLVIVSAIGVVKNGKFVTTSGAKPENKIILTKSIGIEGTAILASDRRDLLISRFGNDFVGKAMSYFDKLSVLKEAMVAFGYGGVKAMHDPTEGGISNALHEVADASKTGFIVYEDKIKVSYETLNICSFFGINPLNFISSGSLLIIAEQDKTPEIVEKLREKEIYASIIGEVVSDVNSRLIVRRDGSVENLVRPLSDELWTALVKKS